LAVVINAAFGRHRMPIAEGLAAAIGNGPGPSIPGSFYPIARPIAPFLGASLADGAGDIRSVLVIIADDPHVSSMAGLLAAARQNSRRASARIASPQKAFPFAANSNRRLL